MFMIQIIKTTQDGPGATVEKRLGYKIIFIYHVCLEILQVGTHNISLPLDTQMSQCRRACQDSRQCHYQDCLVCKSNKGMGVGGCNDGCLFRVNDWGCRRQPSMDQCVCIYPIQKLNIIHNLSLYPACTCIFVCYLLNIDQQCTYLIQLPFIYRGHIGTTI